MFGFLKDKLKSWLGKAKDNVEKKTEKAEKSIKEAKKPEKIALAEKPKKEVKKEKRKRTEEELEQERQVTEHITEDLKKEKVEIKTTEEKFEEQKKEVLEAGEKKKGFFARLKEVFTYKLKEEDFSELFEDLEMLLLENNVAIEVTEALKSQLKQELIGKEMKKSEIADEIQTSLKKAISNILINPDNPIEKIKDFRKQNQEPYKILFFGINGAGKTTSIAKLCSLLQKHKLSCVLAASDTFRAASIEQLQIHADKLQVKLIKSNYGADPSSVAFEAIKYAKTNNIDVVLIDTAGRMHTKDNLLKEMEKICRVTQPNLKVFVAEAISGNDATEQAKAFNDLIAIDGSILSKTDVDEKGGTILSIGYITKKPILYLGVGQAYDDLELFDKDKVMERLGL